MTKSFFGQPKSFYLIFFVELWERFGFYAIQSLLILFMVEAQGYTDSHADSLLAGFTALLYLLLSLGGYIGDHILGTRRMILFGAIVLAAGYLLLSIPFISTHYLLLALAVIAIGNGLFKANPSSLLSKIYERIRVNQDSGFTLYYMAINIGGLLSIALAPVVNKYFGWNMAFLLGFLGLLIAIANYVFMRHLIQDVGSKPDFKRLNYQRFGLVLLGVLLAIGLSTWLLGHHDLLTWLLVIAIVFLLSFYCYEIKKAHSDERRGMWFFLFLFIQSIFYWIIYFQMFSSLDLFALRNVANSLLGIPMQPANYLALDTVWIIVMGPVLSVFYRKLSKKKRDFSLPVKFATGMLIVSMAFFVLLWGAYYSRDTGVLNGLWVLLAYFFMATGELLISALGLSLTSRFVPQRLMGYTMGIWFVSLSVGNIIGGRIAQFASIPKNISHDPVASLPIYAHFFLILGIVALILSLIMFCFVPTLHRFIRLSKRA